MPHVRKVDKVSPPKFFAMDQFKLQWAHFSSSETQPTVDGKAVHATVAMSCEFDFVERGDVLMYQDSQRKWWFGQVVVKAVIDKSRSIVWAQQLRKNTPQQNLELLKHERVHVELAERHARYILQQVKILSVAGSDMGVACQQLIQSADRIRKDHWDKLKNMNAQYERETAHGTNSSVQQQWNSLYLSVKNTNATL